MSGDVGLRTSVVVPAYNEQDMIDACLRMIFAQTVPADEVIVVDNNSTDRTAEILRSYGARIRVLREPRQGIVFARNRGFDAATGDIICRIDADTRLPGTWIEHVRELYADGGIDASTGPSRYHDVLLPAVVDRIDLWIRTAWVRSSGQRLDWVYGANMALRRTAWQQVRDTLCDHDRIHEDLDLGIHLYHSGARVVFSPRTTASISARRIRSRPGDFWRYMTMTEIGYRNHRDLAHPRAYRRAWLTTRALMAMYLPLRVVHEGYRLTSRYRRA
jgi:glycosyltransferase involved in cell wall biosynthesis